MEIRKTQIMMYTQYVAIVFTGLAAGLLYGYDCSVIKGMKNVPDHTYVQSFQSINHAIQNPYFFLTFFGAVAALIIALW